MDLSDGLLAWLKEHILDPGLKTAGLDPSRYELGWEHEPHPYHCPPLPPPSEAQQQERQELMRRIADGLALPLEVVRAAPAWQLAAWDTRHELPGWRDPQQACRDRMGEAAGIHSFLRTQRIWEPVWKHVGGRALHAFIDGQEGPACGIRPVRANGRTSNWRTPGVNVWSWRDTRGKHWDCHRAVEAHRRALLLGEET